MTLEEFNKIVEEFNSYIIEIRKKFEAEPQTVNFVSEIINSFGIETKLVDEAGLVVELPTQKPTSKNIALRVAIDDPIQTVTGLETLIFLNSVKEQWTGALRVIFYNQKASFDFYQRLIQEGVLENISSFYNLRTNANLPLGNVGVKLGSLLSKVEDFTLTVFGKDDSPNIIPVTANIVTALNQLTSRKSDPLKPSKITICSIHSSGLEMCAPNFVEIKGNYSTSNEEVAQQMSSLIKQSIQGFTTAYGVDYEIKTAKHSPVTFDEPLSLHLSKAAKEVLGSHKVASLEYSRNPSPNLTKYLETVPGSILEIGTGESKLGLSSDENAANGFKALSWAFLNR